MLILPPQHKNEWRQPSQRTTVFGKENQTRFRLTARANDGYIVWRGWFDDREDADAFLYSLITGSLLYERELWRLPNPWWPVLDPLLVYEFVTVRIVQTISSSNQTDTVPSDWNNASNSIEVIACGGSGAATANGTHSATGGGGGAYSKSVNVVLTPFGTATFHLESSSAIVLAVVGDVAGISGADAWYNGATLAGSSVGAKGGGGGVVGAPPLVSGNRGLAAGCVGNSTKNNGGEGGNVTDGAAVNTASGGGGGGSTLAGGDGFDPATPNTGGPGGPGGGGASSGTGGTNDNGVGGGAGHEFAGTDGGGGGGGGGQQNGAAIRGGGAGGRHGGGGGGSAIIGNGVAGASGGGGEQALIVMTYTPINNALMLLTETNADIASFSAILYGMPARIAVSIREL